MGLITIAAPPPVEAAGSSLLYSEEFYAAARRRLRPGGILQQWLPYGDAEDFSSVARALQDSFPYVRVFRWTEHWGFHFLASDHPLPNRKASERPGRKGMRSEEHTSELQLHLNLVCRLLLEKKKTQ